MYNALVTQKTENDILGVIEAAVDNTFPAYSPFKVITPAKAINLYRREVLCDSFLLM